MQATKEHISLETAKLLKDCGIESKMYFLELYDEDFNEKYVLNYGKHKRVKKQFPAFTWGEILWEYAELFFGSDEIDTDLLYCNRVWEAWDYGTMSENDFDEIFDPAFIFHTTKIKNLLQQKKYDEADEYFRANCILIKK